MRRCFALGCALLFALAFANAASAGAISELFLSSTIQSLDPAARTAKGGIQVSLWVILFYIFYLGTIWAFNVAMFVTEPDLSPERRPFARYFCRCNMFLAAGDTGMFLAFLIAYLFPESFVTPEGSQKLMQLLLFGVFSTSLTMSVFYWYIGLYYQRAFAGRWDVIILIILTFFVIRLMLHFNPENVWFSMTLPPGQPNYSAWLRNIPLFIYGLLAVSAVLYLSWKRWRNSEGTIRHIECCVQLAMLALIVSFVAYAVDIFYSHKIPPAYIWIIYTVKTLASWLPSFSCGLANSITEGDCIPPVVRRRVHS
jgi:hypothetical protein